MTSPEVTTRHWLHRYSPYYNFFLVFILISLLELTLLTSASAFISGSIIKCFNENETVSVPFLYNDPCMKCKCLNQEVVCDRKQCNNSNNRKCQFNGREYKSGDSWKNASCSLCTCLSGNVSCQAEVCDPNLKCPDGHHLVKHPGDCCQSCTENDGECSLIQSTDSTETLVSFDRKSSPFQGKCNYRLVHDCLNRTFWVHLRHEVLNETSDKNPAEQQIVRTLILRVEETRIKISHIKSMKRNDKHDFSIRVGRQPASFPFLELGVISVLKNAKGVLIRANIGVKVSWNGLNDLRITLPSKFKSKVCGLCGNFNGKPEDDRLTRKGRLTNRVDKFINSWKVGKTGYCASLNAYREKKKNHDMNQPTSETAVEPEPQTDPCSSNWEKKLQAMTLCNVLKDNAFGSCHRSLSILPFYKECVSQVCRCEGKNCFCPSVLSYVSQCNELGLKVNDEKTRSVCGSPSVSNSVTVIPSPRRGVRQRAKKVNSLPSTHPEPTVTCPPGMIFNQCSSPCKRTCKSPEETDSEMCRKPCRPDCQCPPHLVWHESQCILPSSCPESS